MLSYNPALVRELQADRERQIKKIALHKELRAARKANSTSGKRPLVLSRRRLALMAQSERLA
jgi:hypothetical protein